MKLAFALSLGLSFLSVVQNSKADTPEIRAPSAKMKSQVQVIVDEVNGMLGSLDQPVHPKIILKPSCLTNSEMEFDDDGNITGLISIVGYGCANYHGQFPADALAHEYGHLVLNTNVKKYLSSSLDMNPIPKTVIQKILLLRDGSYGPCKTNFCLTERIIAPYDEFFADVVAVLREGNGRAPMSAQLRPDLRDFTHEHPFTIPAPLNRNPHTAMAAARSWIWKNYLSKPSVLKQKGEVLEAVLKAAASETDRLSRLLLEYKGTGLPPEFDPAERNKQFIEALDRQLKPVLQESEASANAPTPETH